MPSLGNSMDRMKHLLSTGEHSDVHFLMGDGDAKEVLPAHQLILKSTSVVFDGIFRFNAKKRRTNASANCLVVEVPDVEATAFKVMLSFIYTDILSELNEDNAMAVLYAAKKYNIPGLVRPSLQIPFSELRNIFFAYAQARLFDLEDFVSKYLRYICQNAAHLFRSDQFLHIDQKILCNLLDNDRLLLKDEFEIWEAALRWADEKCHQNGNECSSGNRRSVLGPALFKIRFLQISMRRILQNASSEGTDEKKCLGFYLWCDAREGGPWNCFFSATYRIVSEENNGTENSIGTHCDCVLNQYHTCISPGFESFITFAELMDPSNGFHNREEDKVTLVIDFTVKKEKIDKFILDQSKSNGTISMEIEKMSEFAREIIGSERKSEAVYIKGFPWKIWAEIEKKDETTDNEKWLGIYLLCDAPEEDENWSCKVSSTFRIVSQKNGMRDYKRGELTEEETYNCKARSWGYTFISFAELMNPSKGFYNKREDKVTLAIDFNVNEAKMERKS